MLSTKCVYKIIYMKYMYKEDLALNNLQWLLCLKTQPNQIKLNEFQLIKLRHLIPSF